MEITPVGNAPRPVASQGDNSSGTISSDFDTFLKMLTVQMQNQDPLNPLKSEELSVQLATFSGVEQQVRTNDLLEGLGRQFGLAGLSETAGWVGMEARSTAAVHFTGTPVDLTLPSSTLGNRAQLVVKDDTGAEVARTDVPLTATSLSWDGRDPLGQLLPPGRYDLSIERLNGEDLVGTGPVGHYATILEARVDAGENLLVLSSGETVTPDDVSALRVPEAA